MWTRITQVSLSRSTHQKIGDVKPKYLNEISKKMKSWYSLKTVHMLYRLQNSLLHLLLYASIDKR